MENFRKNRLLIFLFSEMNLIFIGKYVKKQGKIYAFFIFKYIWYIWKCGKDEFSTICGKVVGKPHFICKKEKPTAAESAVGR